MIYYTDDIHGSTLEIVTFCMRFKPTKDDTIVILGDVGANYFGDFRDNKLKMLFLNLSRLYFAYTVTTKYALGIFLHIRQRNGTVA